MVNLFLGLSRSPSKHPLHFGGKGERELNLAQKREMERNKKKVDEERAGGFFKTPSVNVCTNCVLCLKGPLGVIQSKKEEGEICFFVPLSLGKQVFFLGGARFLWLSCGRAEKVCSYEMQQNKVTSGKQRL